MRSHDPRNQIQIRTHHAPARQAPKLSPSKRGYGNAWQKLRLMVLARSPLCVRCQEPATDVDHIQARNLGGSDAAENLQTLCHACHSRKTFHEDRLGGGFIRKTAKKGQKSRVFGGSGRGRGGRNSQGEA